MSDADPTRGGRREGSGHQRGLSFEGFRRLIGASDGRSQSRSDDTHPRLQLENTKDMQQVMQTLNIDMEHYKIPDNLVEGSPLNVQEKIGAFNTVLEAIHKEPPFRKPFAVTISANDLGNYGDVVAGAKLAKELSQFYKRIEEWKDTSIFLHLTGISDRYKADKERVAKDILQGTSVRLIYDLQDNEFLQNREHVRFAYPTSIRDDSSVDFSVKEYGIARFSDVPGTYSSGPGYGSLGTLGIPEKRLQQAIEAADHPEKGSLICKLDQLLSEDSVESFHFGYFSREPPKGFVKKISEKTEKSRIGIVIAKSQSKFTEYVSDFLQEGFTVRALRLDQMGVVKQDNTSRGIEGDQRWQPAQANKHVTLVNFPDGVAQQDMLSLYYRSDAPIGATGDQSFIEAYQMRSKKIETSASPDIWYDVSPQKGALRYQLIELEKGKAIQPDNTIMQGLSPIKIHDSVTEALEKKNLVYPIAMLINQTLQKREG
jgi:hypothetical protein